MSWGAGPPKEGLVLSAEEVEGVIALAAEFGKTQVAVEKTGGEPDELTLVWFLRARKMSVSAANKQLQDERRWRAMNSVDELIFKLDPAHAIFESVTPHAHHGYSKEGMPVYFERSGEVDVPKLLTLVTRKQAAIRHVWHMEMMGARMASTNFEGRPVTKQIEIRDLKHLSLAPNSAATQLFKDTIYID